MSHSSVASWETGKRDPDSAMIAKLAAFFDTTTDYLLGRTDDPTTLSRPAHRPSYKPITAEDFAEGYDPEEPTEDEETFRKMEELLERVTEGPYNNRRFRDPVAKEIIEDLTHICDTLNEEFDLSPNGILHACEGASAGFIEEFITVFEYAAKSIRDQRRIQKEERDIAVALEQLMSNLEHDNALAFDGEPMTDEDKELLRDALEHSLRTARQVAKRKFTPKKYRKD